MNSSAEIEKTELTDIRLIRMAILVFLITSLWFFIQLIINSSGLDKIGSSLRWTIAMGAGLIVIGVLGVFFGLTWTRASERLTKIYQSLLQFVSHNSWIMVIYFLATSVLFGWFLLGPFGHQFENISIRIGIYLSLVSVGSLLLRGVWTKQSFWMLLVTTAVWYAAIYQIMILLPGISSYPFTITWSEGSAYYYASSYFSERIYGIKISLPLINPTRHLLLAIPFLIDGMPIWVHRLWEVVLWLTISGGAIALLVRRLDVNDKLLRWIYVAWVFIFLFQGPVYYFLLISLIPILWGFEAGNSKRVLLLVIVGSVWVGASRVNWIPFPGLFATVLYFLEEETNNRHWIKYLLKPILWVSVGTILALLVWYGYAFISGNPVEQFGVYLSSTMLWYRLLPNATFKFGVLLATLIASLPILGYIGLQLYKSGFNFHIIRRIGLGMILLVFFGGGLVVSAKIGGGNNIHNLDAYLMILLVTGSYLYFRKSPYDYSYAERTISDKLINGFVLVALLMPIYFTLQQGRPLKLQNTMRTEKALQTVQGFAYQAQKKGGEVLFLGERQLLTFNQVPGITLVPDYERMYLMEMVMGGDEDYLNEFHERIANQEFSLIITEPLKIIYKGKGQHFGDENDIYVHWVTEPVLCYYEAVHKINGFPIQFLTPRTEKGDC